MNIKNNFLRNLKLRDIIFYNEPIYHPRKDYFKALERIKKLSSKEKNVLSVYMFGEITCPGISDIDILFVIKNTTRLPKFLKNILKDKALKYVAIHPFLIVNEEIMQDIRYIYPNSNYQLMCGKEIKIDNLSKKQYRQSVVFLIVDTILRHFPSDYLTILISKRVNLRMCLLRLNALNNTIKLFRELNKTIKKDWGIYSNDITRLRKNWFNISQEKRRKIIVDLLKRAVYVSYDLILEFEKIFLSVKPGNINVKTRSDIIFRGTAERLSFTRSLDVENSIDGIISHFKRYGNFYSILPMSYLVQLCAHASLGGPLSSYIRKRLSSKCKLKNINEVLKKRIMLLNEQVDIAIKLKHSHYPCFFPLGYKNTSGFENKLRYLAIIILNNSIFRKILYFLRSKTKLV